MLNLGCLALALDINCQDSMIEIPHDYRVSLSQEKKIKDMNEL